RTSTCAARAASGPRRPSSTVACVRSAAWMPRTCGRSARRTWSTARRGGSSAGRGSRARRAGGRTTTCAACRPRAKGAGGWGGEGRLLVARGGAGKLTTVATHKTDDYRGIAIRAPNDVWIATNANDIGSAGTLLHWNGTKLVRFDHLTANFLSAVAFVGNAIWA